MILVTGGFGFIGSNLIKELNNQGIRNIVVCDNLKNNPEKYKNLADCFITDYVNKDDVFKLNPKKIDKVFHLGACANTLEFDSEFMMENNFTFSKNLLNFVNCPFIYASSAAIYGNSISTHSNNNYTPLNVYGYSKLLFDRYVYYNIKSHQVTGLRFFNVYGPNESHKGKMASVIHQLATGKLKHLFENGEQKRDFIHVDDIISIILHFSDTGISGIFNAGTGKSTSFNEIKNLLGVDVDYISIPEHIKPNYQEFTQANLNCLRDMGKYEKDFIDISEGIKKV